jgi:hypothetical protein
VVDVFVFLQEIDDWLYSFLHGLTNCLGFIEVRFLFEQTDLVIAVKPDFSFMVSVLTCDDAEEAGFTRAIETEHTDFSSVEEGEPYVFEDLFGRRVGLGDALHGEDYFFAGHDRVILNFRIEILDFRFWGLDFPENWAAKVGKTEAEKKVEGKVEEGDRFCSPRAGNLL